jgi:HEPN domain-containing protein
MVWLVLATVLLHKHGLAELTAIYVVLVLLALDPPETEAVAFHCQQRSILRGFLAYNNEEPPHTHDLDTLLDLSIGYELSLQHLRTASKLLTPFAVDVHYPRLAIHRLQKRPR